MTDDEVRKIIKKLFFTIKMLMISEQQLILLEYIESQSRITSPELAEYYGISTQSASTRLYNLMKAGYLRRHDEGDPTGGPIYSYEVRIK